MTALQAATRRAMELQLPAFLAALAASPDAGLSARVRFGTQYLHLRMTWQSLHSCIHRDEAAASFPLRSSPALLIRLRRRTRLAWPSKVVMFFLQVVTVALNDGAMAACVRLRGPQPCVLDSWNTSRLTGALTLAAASVPQHRDAHDRTSLPRGLGSMTSPAPGAYIDPGKHLLFRPDVTLFLQRSSRRRMRWSRRRARRPPSRAARAAASRGSAAASSCAMSCSR